METRGWGKFGGRVIVLAAALAFGAACSNSGDVRQRWVESFGSPDGVDRVYGVSCQEPFPGTLEGCALRVDLEEGVDAATVSAIVEHYLEVAEELYPEGSDDRGQLGSLVFGDDSRASYLFSPFRDDRGGPLRTGPDDAAIDAYVRARDDDDRFHRVDISDDAEKTRATIELPGNDPEPLFASIGRFATEFGELGSTTFRARASSGSVPGVVADVSVTTEQGRLPETEWRFALEAVGRERAQAFDVRVAPGSVHLVAVVDPPGSDDERLEDVATIRERIVARAPEGMAVTVGSRPRRD